MSANTKIEWTDHTFNPWWGCQKVGPGCDHCYAENLDKRTGGQHWGPGAERRRTSVKNWNDPVRWNKQADAFFAEHGRRQRVFCASMADVFDNAVDPQWRIDLFKLIEATPNLDWLLLTKRIGNVLKMVREGNFFPSHWPNVWLGATIVNQEEADRDIPKLLAVPAAKRFLSMEPLLGAVNIGRWAATAKVACKVCLKSFWLHDADPCNHREGGSWTLACPHCGDCRCKPGWTPMDARTIDMQPPEDWVDRKVGRFDRVHPTIQVSSAIDWVIVGGESGPGARPMHPDWARSLRDQCEAAGVPFLFKQWGEWTPGENVERHHGTIPIASLWNNEWQVSNLNLATDGGHIDDEPDLYRVGKKEAGRFLDGRTWDGYPT